MKAIIPLFFVLATGCTSLGHEGRSTPQTSRELSEIPKEFTLIGSGPLSTAIENLLVARGINVNPPARQHIRGEPRYIIYVNSTELDICIPEGSRQMHFGILVQEAESTELFFASKGQFGCMDTIVKAFENWLF